MIRLFLILFGYMFGLFPSGYLLGKTKGVDIRSYGSGNVGTTNSFRVFGKLFGVITLVLDILKTVAAVLLGVYILKATSNYDAAAHMYYVMYIGFGAILGHDFPFYFKFKGGKGVASTCGMCFVLGDIRILAVALGIFIVIFLLSGYVSVASILGLTSLAAVFILFGQLGILSKPPVSLDSKYLTETYIIIILIALIGIYKHKENIKRLIKGNENRFNIFGKGRN